MICNHGEGVVCLRCHDEITAARARIAELEETLSSSYDDVESMNACLERYESRVSELESRKEAPVTQKSCSTCKYHVLDAAQHPCCKCESVLFHTRWEPAEPSTEEIDARRTRLTKQEARIAELDNENRQARSHLADVLFCFLQETAEGDGVQEEHYRVVMNAKAFLGHAIHESTLLGQSLEAFEDDRQGDVTP